MNFNWQDIGMSGDKTATVNGRNAMLGRQRHDWLLTMSHKSGGRVVRDIFNMNVASINEAEIVLSDFFARLAKNNGGE